MRTPVSVFLSLLCIAQIVAAEAPENAVQRVRLASVAIAPLAGPDLPGQGLAAVITREILALEGWELELVFLPAARVRVAVKSGSADGFLLSAASEPSEAYEHTDTFLASSLLIIGREQADTAQLRAKAAVLGTPRSWGIEPLLTGFSITTVQTMDQCLLMLAAQRIPFCVAEQFAYNAFLLGHPEVADQLVALSPPVYEYKYGHATRPGDAHGQAFIQAFNRGLRRWRQQQNVQAFAQTYLRQWQDQAPRTVKD